MTNQNENTLRLVPTLPNENYLQAVEGGHILKQAVTAGVVIQQGETHIFLEEGLLRQALGSLDRRRQGTLESK